ncbi:four helix bundle protein [Candidatus Woesebacteria bacterium]|nr:four helix bundle protein [Candidatus Woesebacteria bacterium]
MIRDVTNLDVYQLSFEALEILYKLVIKIPHSERDTIDQLKRASESVPANIAEGFAKRSSEKEFKRFLKIAIGSSDEVVTHLRMVCITVPNLQPQAIQVADTFTVLSKRLNKLHSVWRTGNF